MRPALVKPDEFNPTCVGFMLLELDIIDQTSDPLGHFSQLLSDLFPFSTFAITPMIYSLISQDDQTILITHVKSPFFKS